MENFFNEIAELLEVDSVTGSETLNSFACWDSLTILSIIALVDDNYSVTLSAAEVNDAKTIDGLKNLVVSKKS
jgi:acyl carrier protein